MRQVFYIGNNKAIGGEAMRTDRLVSIIMLLLERDRMTAQALADRFEVSPRTIYRDLEAISMAGIPVRAVSGVNGGIEIMREFKLDKRYFTAAELTALLQGLSSLSGMLRSDALANALAKVKSIVPAAQAGEIELHADQLRVDMSPWMGKRDLRPLLETIRAAMQAHRLLSFKYIDIHGGETTRTAEPYRLVLKGGNWYLQAYCRLRGDFRLFRLTRILEMKPLDAEFGLRDCPELLQFPADAQPAAARIRLRFHHALLERMLDFCAYQDITPDGGESYIADFPFIENDYFYDMLLSFGSRCACLEPARVRMELKRRIEEMAALYT